MSDNRYYVKHDINCSRPGGGGTRTYEALASSLGNRPPIV